MFPFYKGTAIHNQTIKKNLAFAYQLLSHLGLDDHTYTHLSARVFGEKAFYIYPFGLRFEEVTTQNLLKVSFDGSVLEGLEESYNRTGYMIHGSIYEKRPDLAAIFHLHTPEIVAVSACQEGLMTLSQWALHFYGRVGYHSYDSLTLEKQQGIRLTDDLGNLSVLFLRNHGSITCGRTIPEAMFYTYHLQKACETQCLLLSMKQPMVIPKPDTCQKTVKDLLSFEESLGERDWRAWIRKLKKMGAGID